MTDYTMLCKQLAALAEIDDHCVPLLANASAMLYEAMTDVNWAGFYIMRDGQLVLGPFQGKVACVHIPLNSGVCGATAREDRTQRVPDVHAFPGHIACDSASNSEIVVPVHSKGAVVAVLDIDSPVLNRFTAEDQSGLEAFVRAVEAVIEWE
ncbi:MAG: GAF domain-containing protein [bacterium]